jgi:hypothetical protein
MSEREDEHFDIDDEFLGEAEESHDFDPLLERTERRPKAVAVGKRGKAAWSRVEDVLAERQLEKELFLTGARPGAGWKTYSPSAS